MAFEYEHNGTLEAVSDGDFDSKADCEVLMKAMKGFGTDEASIINVLAYRNCAQRIEISKTFKTLYGKDLVAEIDDEAGGNFSKICQGLLVPLDEYDAIELKKAMKGAGTNEDTLIEIICTRTNDQLDAIKDTYKRLNGTTLEADVASEMSGHSKELLISCLQANRSEEVGSDIDEAEVDADAVALHEAGEKQWGTDESKFNSILVSRSYSHLRAVFRAYKVVTGGNDIEDSIESELSGPVAAGMVAIVQCIKYKPYYFARALKKAMKGLGTKDEILIRIIVNRCEVDMVQIKTMFEKVCKGETLAKWIQGEISGDYLKLILALIGEKDAKK